MTQLALDFEHREALGADDFLVAAPNRAAVLWLDRWPDWPAPALAIHGPPGCGKTHLAHVWQARSGARMLRPRDVAGGAPSDLLGASGSAVVEGADGGGFDEAALFHLYNAAAERGGHLLLTGRTAPARWPLALADLRSRLRAAPAVAVEKPDDALIGALIAKLFADRQLRVGDDVIGFLVARMERSFDAARAIVGDLDRMALAGRRNITVPLARQVLKQREDRKQGEMSWTSD